MMKILSVMVILMSFTSGLTFASHCPEHEFTGKVEFENISGSCHSYPNNPVIKAMIALAKEDAIQHANWRFLYYNGSVQTSQFKITCTQIGQVAEVAATADFSGKVCH